MYIILFRYVTVFRDPLSVVHAIEIRRISFKANDSQREDKLDVRESIVTAIFLVSWMKTTSEFVSSSLNYTRVGIERVMLPRRLQIEQREGDNWHRVT